MFTEIAKEYQEKFLDFHPFPQITDRSFWDHLSKDIPMTFNTQVDEHIQYTYPTLPMSKFMDYQRNGNRTDYETIYFERRRHLSTAVLLECIHNNGDYLDTILNGIFLICEESAWQLPAHNAYIRDTPTLILPDKTRPILDLFACETGAFLATIDYLLGEKLDKISPQVCKRIRQEIDDRIIQPYLTTHFWWMGHGDEPMNNWTIWCTQNVLFTFFLTPQSDALRHKAFQKANTSIDCFLKAYGEDGCCDEGALYYRHSGLCLFNTIELLNAVTDHAYSRIYSENKIINMCAYIHNVHVQDHYYINFSDCSAVLEGFNAREFLFAKRTNNKKMMAHVASDFRTNEDPFLNDEINLFYRLQSISNYEEIMHYPLEPSTLPSDIYYESVGLFILRDRKFTLAVKAGDNDDNHNHNDTGSFILYKDGLPVFVDIGVESYTAKTFSNDRYSIWTMQSDYHNLPTLDGQMQHAGKAYQAKDIDYTLHTDAPFIHMNLIDAYPTLSSIIAYERKIILYKDKRKDKKIEIKDFIKSKSTSNHFDFISNLITYDQPIIKGHHISLGNLVHIQLDGDIKAIDIEPLPISDSRLKKAWNKELYRLRIHVTSDYLNIAII